MNGDPNDYVRYWEHGRFSFIVTPHLGFMVMADSTSRLVQIGILMFVFSVRI